MKHKNIMIYGTASNAGKSIVVTGLCRIFKQDGYKVSPFKSQNMALNSYVTDSGGEIGVAQAIQAEAAGVNPEIYMNPILMKPTSDRKSQIILNGKALQNMDAAEYFVKRKFMKEEVMKSYNYIRENYDISVIEGAGSPAEINLKQDDIVNTGMAEMADSPAILVGDIDRGGVFASIYGTIMLLTEEERKRVKGVIINKFRGDVALLEPGLKMIEELINKPVLGVLPYFEVNVGDEDSLSSKFDIVKNDGIINLSIIKLKHTSNFTDFDPLYNCKELNIKYVESGSEMGDEDIIVIPGSKNTIEDLKAIKESGIAEKIVRAVRNGKMVIGICGGYQMLGQKVIDKNGIESSLKEINGLGLFDSETMFESEKITEKYRGEIEGLSGEFSVMNGMSVSGYEIHHGITGETKERRFESKGAVLGTYIHGIFENDRFTSEILKIAGEKKGVEINKEIRDYKSYKESEFDKLAEIFRKNLDMDKIYKIMDGEDIVIGR
jgi:adenosylcobyric acid synthase